MSKDGDKKNYAEAMIADAFRRMFVKETNHVEAKSDVHGLAMEANATCSDTHRFLTFTLAIEKDGE